MEHGKTVRSEVKQYTHPDPPSISAREAENSASHQGYITKQGERSSSWKKRYFVLRNNQLLYFKSKKSSLPKGFIDISGLYAIPLDSETVASHSPAAVRSRKKQRTCCYCCCCCCCLLGHHRRHFIQLDTPYRSYFLETPDEASKDLWVEELNQASASSPYKGDDGADATTTTTTAATGSYVRVVDSHPKGVAYYKTIRDAVQASNSGDHIFIRPGTYKENITINKPLNITGTGKPEEINIIGEASDPIFTINMEENGDTDQTQVHLTNLNMINKSSGTGYDLIEVISGSLALENCGIQHAAGNGISSWKQSSVSIRRCDIGYSQCCGVLATDDSFVKMESCDIFENLW
eukprot:gb/GECH01004862.1/.p1 GENE.gb/GECH01004862.1/~~gb/GECH01004862.1/.p1  ORF type:complete len:349 (+),score=100.48 gb/GECH01004862.1/:1-1047(+)